MPAPQSLAFLPKPVLFGLYGAIGGLLGALVFGEPVWQLFPPPPPPAAKPEPQVAIAASKEFQVIQDKANSFTVEVARAEFDGPVEVTVGKLPAGIQVAPITIAKGQTSGVIVVKADDRASPGTTPLRVTASATADGKRLTADTIVSLQVVDPARPQADIVFVLDVTGSMDWAIYGIRDGIQSFAQQLRVNKIDFRIGLVAFRDLTNPSDERAGLELMQVLQFGGSPFTSDANAFRAEVGNLRATGGGDTPESSLEAVARASDLDFRPTATRVLLLITDAPPKVKLHQNEPQTNDEEIEAVKKTATIVRDKGIDAVHLVVRDYDAGDGTNDRKTYQALMEAGAIKGAGQFFNLRETVARKEEGFKSLIHKFTTSVVEAAASKNPVKPVVTEGAAVPVLTAASLQSSRQYAAGSEGRLLVLSAVWTGAIAALVCLMLLAGQHHYLRGTLPPGGSVTAGIVGGLLVGLLGGACGYGLYLMSPGGPFLNVVFKIFGWTLLGGLAGAGLSLFIPNLKWVHGLAGGAAGGVAGAVGFLVVNGTVGQSIGGSAGDAVGRLAGGLIVGFCIGLMVALVEAAFRSAWLEVRYGARETITVNLGPEPVKIGGDAQACTVWARGAVPVALRYFIRGGQVVCEDAPTRTETVVNNGDSREAGNVTVTVRTGSKSATGAPAAKPTAAPSPPRPTVPVRPEPKPRDFGPSDDDDLLPMPIPPSSKPAVASSPVAAPPRPPAPAPTTARPPAPSPTVGSKPAMPTAPLAAAKLPSPKPAAVPRDPDACPSCGRKNPGRPGSRYCMLCDQTY